MYIKGTKIKCYTDIIPVNGNHINIFKDFKDAKNVIKNFDFYGC